MPRKRVRWLGYDTGVKPGEAACTIKGCTSPHGETGHKVDIPLDEIGYYYPMKENTNRFAKGTELAHASRFVAVALEAGRSLLGWLHQPGACRHEQPRAAVDPRCRGRSGVPVKSEVHAPSIMSEHIKDLGRFFGADQVGIAQLGPGGDTEYSFAIVILIRTEDDPRTSQGIGGQAAALTGEYVSFNLAAAIREFGFRATRSGQADGHRLAVCAGLGQEINARFFEDNKSAAEPLTTDQAKAIVSAVVRYAEDAGYAIAVAVVDGAGEHIESSAMAGAATDLAALALNKAYSAAKLQVATHQLGRGAATPSFQEPPGFQHERLVEVGGGYPAFQGDAVVGAVGLAGSPSPQIDLLCCQAGSRCHRHGDALSHTG